MIQKYEANEKLEMKLQKASNVFTSNNLTTLSETPFQTLNYNHSKNKWTLLCQLLQPATLMAPISSIFELLCCRKKLRMRNRSQKLETRNKSENQWALSQCIEVVSRVVNLKFEPQSQTIVPKREIEVKN